MATNITLGALIDRLAECAKRDADCPVYYDFDRLCPGKPDSYRGYYADLAIGITRTETTVADLLAACLAVRGTVLEGYKGGMFRMDSGTAVWAANYSECTDTAIVGVTDHDWAVILDTAYIA
jgi:hypothetical protein